MKKVIDFLLIILSFLVVVIPNSFQSITLFIFFLLFILIYVFNRRVYDVYLVLNWLVLSLLFFGFILISPIGNNYKYELIFKYILSPIFWITIFCYIRKYYTLEDVIKKLIILGFISNISVLILYIAMYSGYISFVQYFVEVPNIDSKSGLGFILHVYGSLIFFGIAMMPTILFIKSIFYRILYVFLFFISAILSGRTALILFVILGFSLFFIYLKKYKFNFKNISILVFVIFILGQIVYNEFTKYFDVNLLSYINESHIDKIRESGGEERSIQSEQLMQQFYNNPLGSGFVTLSIIRNEIKTFNYEVLSLATLMRFGIITYIIIVYSLIKNFSYLFLRSFIIKKEERDFFILGFASIIIVSSTNPYLESFCFQWMFFGPLVLLKEKIVVLKSELNDK